MSLRLSLRTRLHRLGDRPDRLPGRRDPLGHPGPRGGHHLTRSRSTKGVLIARNVADANLRSSWLCDIEEIQSDIQSRIDAKVLYVVIYDRYGTPARLHEEIADRKEIITESRLQGDARRDSVFAQPQDVFFGRRIRRVLEIEIPIFAQGSPDKWGSVKIGLSLADTQRRDPPDAARPHPDRDRRVRARPRRGDRPGPPDHRARSASLAEGTVRISRGDFTPSDRRSSRATRSGSWPGASTT